MLVCACACGGGAPADGRTTAVTAVYPLAWLAGQIAPDAALTALAEGGGEAHDLDLTPPQRAAVETADVVLYMGELGYQPQVEQAAGAATGQVVDVAAIAGDRMRPGDPHLWFDAGLMAEVATRAGEAFAAADPDGAEGYRANAERVRGELAALADDVEGLLGGDCAFDQAIVSHEAYGYLLEPFGLRQRGVAGVQPELGASSAELAELVGEIEAEGLRFVLAEPEEGRADAEALAAEAGVELLEILNLESVDERLAGEGYPALLRRQAETFATALGCA